MSSKASSKPVKNSAAMDEPAVLPEAKSPTKKKRHRRKVPKPSSEPTTAQEHTAVDAVPSKDHRRKRKTTDPPSLAAAAEAASSYSGQKLRVWTDADEVALLSAAIDYRNERGSLPKPSNLLDFFNIVRPSLLTKSLKPEQVKEKLKRMRRKYLDNPRGPGATAGAHDRRVHKLSAKLWSSELETSTEEKNREEDGEGSAVAEEEDGGFGCYYPFIWQALEDYWGEEDGCLNASVIEALKQVDPWKAKKLDVKWKRQLARERRFSVKHQHELDIVFQMLA